MPDLSRFTSLFNLEISYNQISSLEPLRKLPGQQLTHLYAAVNKLASMEGIEHLSGAGMLVA